MTNETVSPAIKIDVFEPGSTEHQIVRHSIEKTCASKKEATARYNQLVAAYNAGEVGCFISLAFLTVSMTSVKKVLKYRGLKPGVDFELYRPAMDTNGKPLKMGERPLMVQKLSGNRMRVA